MNNEMDKMPTEEEMRGVFKVLSEEVPGLLERMIKLLYGVKEGQDLGRAIGSFYNALRESGMSDSQAFALTQDFMSNLCLGKALGNIGRGFRMDEQKRCA